MIALRTRDANRDNLAGSLDASALQIAGSVTGGVGRDHQAGWLFAGRESFSQYLMKGIGAVNFAMGYTDETARLDWDVAAGHRLSLLAMDGGMGVDPASSRDPQSIDTFDYGSRAHRSRTTGVELESTLVCITAHGAALRAGRREWPEFHR